jgi:hypothetical protein
MVDEDAAVDRPRVAPLRKRERPLVETSMIQTNNVAAELAHRIHVTLASAESSYSSGQVFGASGASGID